VHGRSSPPAAAFPSELVGVWLGGKTNGTGWLEFAPDGSFRTDSYQGRAVLDGPTLTLVVDGSHRSSSPGRSAAASSTWTARPTSATTARPVAPSRWPGEWININGWTSIRFGSGGSFQLDDQANAEVTSGHTGSTATG
jgi:hypothetical protein